MKIVVATLTAAVLLAHPGLAQTPAASIDDPEATLLQDLVVVAPTTGPAWWRVSKGESVVWIMALPDSATPKRLKWDRSTLKSRLTGAHALLAPPTIYLGFPEPEAVSAKAGATPIAVSDVETRMPPGMAERFARARARIGKPAKRYAKSSVPIALSMLYRDHLTSGGLSERGDVLRWAVAMAKARKVPVVRPATAQAGQLNLAQIDPDRPEAAACYDALISSADVPMERYRTVAAGWARGDLRTATSGPRNPLSLCENRLFNLGGSRRSIEIQTAAIEAALAKPGKTVAVANLRSLLAAEGIISRLAAEGYDIRYPSGVQEEAL